MDRSILATNVAALRKSLGLKQTAFAELLGVDQSYVSKWERGTEPSSRPLARMAELAGCTVEQFMSNPLQLPAPARQPSPNFNGAATSEAEVVHIQKLDLSLSMGPGTLIDDYVEAETLSFDPSFIRGITRAPTHRLKLVSGIGDSMYPTLAWGDTILVDTTDRQLAKQDGIYWIDLYGAAGLKRLRTVGRGRVLVISDNPAVSDQEVDADDLRIEGRAIWVARGL